MSDANGPVMEAHSLHEASATARIRRSQAEVRGECTRCGSHAYFVPGVPESGKCGNCGSVELRPLGSA